MNKRKSNCLRTLPWGIPDYNEAVDDVLSSSSTCWVRPTRNGGVCEKDVYEGLYETPLKNPIR
jgi:hypothetical protein